MSAGDLIQHESGAASAGLAPERTLLVLASALGRIGFHIPEGYGAEQGGAPDIAPLMNFDARGALAERVKEIAPDGFKTGQVSGNVERALSEAENSETVRTAFGEVKLRPEDIGVGRALWTPSQEGSIFTRLLRGPASIVPGQIGEISGNFGLRYLLPERDFGDIVTFARELVGNDLAAKDRSGKIWIPTPQDIPTIKLTQGQVLDRDKCVAATPVTALTEAKIISRLARVIAGADQADAEHTDTYEPINEFLCLIGKNGKATPVAAAAVGWSVGHKAVSLTCRSIG